MTTGWWICLLKCRKTLTIFQFTVTLKFHSNLVFSEHCLQVLSPKTNTLQFSIIIFQCLFQRGLHCSNVLKTKTHNRPTSLQKHLGYSEFFHNSSLSVISYEVNPGFDSWSWTAQCSPPAFGQSCSVYMSAQARINRLYLLCFWIHSEFLFDLHIINIKAVLWLSVCPHTTVEICGPWTNSAGRENRQADV